MVRYRRLAFALVLLAGAAVGQAQVVLKPASGGWVTLREKAIRSETRIENQVAVTKLWLTFQNPIARRIEADFVYALPPDALVTEFAYYNGNERVLARVSERERAAEIYQQITTWNNVGRDPALVEMTGKRTFRARIFPVNPESDLRVEMTLVQALPNREGGHAFTLPLRREKGEPIDRIDIAVKVVAEAGQSVTNNYGVAARGNAVEWHGRNVRPDKDLRVRIAEATAAQGVTTHLLAARSGGANGFFALFLTPRGKAIGGPVSIAGVSVTEMLPGRTLKAGRDQSVLLTGRYQGVGRARVKWGDQTFEVVFPPSAQANSPAAKLWAARKIESLGKTERHRAEIVALSIRHTLPSPFTSWIAIPKAERAAFARQIASAKAVVLARRFGDAVRKRGVHSPEAVRLRAETRAAAKAAGIDSRELLADPLESVYGPKIRQISDAIAERLLAGRRDAETERLRRRLLQTVKEAEQTEPPNLAWHPKVSQRIRVLAMELTDERYEGRPNSQVAKRARLELERWRPDVGNAIEQAELQYLRGRLSKDAPVVARVAATGVGPKTPEDKAAIERWQRNAQPSARPEEILEYPLSEYAQNAVQRIMDAKYLGQSSDGLDQDRQVLERIRRQPGGTAAVRNASSFLATKVQTHLTKRVDQNLSADETDWNETEPLLQALDRLWHDRELGISIGGYQPGMWVFAEMFRTSNQRYAEAVAEDRVAAVGPRIRERMAKAYQILGLPDGTNDVLRQALTGKYYEAMYLAKWEYRRTRPDHATYAATMTRFRRLAAAMGLDPDAELRKPTDDRYLVNPQMRDDFLFALRDGRPAEEIERLAKRLRVNDTDQKGPDWAAMRQERIRTELELDRLETSPRTPEEEARRAALVKRANELRARMGDPLLTFDAPANALRVVAVMPDGEVKPMAWVPLRNRWEVRFDVPAGAQEGEVTVRIYAVMPDGTRLSGTSTYHIDVTPPRGTAGIVRVGGGVRFAVEGSEDLARVTAILPDGGEFTLRREPTTSRFVGDGPALAPGARVRFVLLDKAHNRAEIDAACP